MAGVAKAQMATTMGMQTAKVRGRSSQMGSGRKVPRHPLALGVEVEAGAAQVEPAGHGSSRQMGNGHGLPRRQVVVIVAAVLEAMVEVRYVFDMTSTD